MEEKPNYTEDAVSIAIATNLAVLSFPFSRFSVVPISRKKERWLGADARLLSSSKFLPFYMQFKRPFAHTTPSRAKIIKDRESLEPPLSTSPRTLFFDLQDKQPKHRDYQHNVLFRLHKRLRSRGIGDAAYVCPLFLDRQTYFYASHMSGIKSWLRNWPAYPFRSNLVQINSKSCAPISETIPVLAEHISIPPHKLVTDAKHKYSFTESGSEVCFHSSPESLTEGEYSFSSWLENMILSSDLQGNSLYFDDSLDFLKELVSEVLGNKNNVFKPSEFESGEQAWFAWGHFLKEQYGI
ncbi:hypothetical protein FKQ62_12400 [Vibrio sp. B1-2]|uniref:hypothetical protein n=1 Tax=Vibrio sp. B1-2 TaxID=2591465 RepID=UPI001483ADDC|nr:hypothetical protein [Vibrio sp. B1-2]NNO00249.1 hypothetical protein [Vibrio sp. B1-2]